ncbi:uncharacterized protein LOC121936628 isoform X2 [Sceloporus undulatus]|uniref:uncharacterized protein LOC121936628 isoform X2 n=1 Tax=Sceloporus undulatus TaxID=8520 RepID=UPI001C4AE70C|nr:uncharacterized protein LOC121936628 isoform X2 [Sceloporus undulatus]
MVTSSALWPLLLWLSSCWLATQATEPDCTHVADFDNCPGNPLDFCPRGVACGCKDQKPVCKCPAYRSGWQNYWYLGSKCDQLWSTLDLIVVAALPAVALSLTVAVAMQWSNYCKRKRGKVIKRRSIPERERRHHGQHNKGYAPNSADKARNVSQPPGRKDDGISQNYRFPKLAVQSQAFGQEESPRFGGFSYTHQPLRRAAPLGSEIPDADYEDENPFTAMAMQQFPYSTTL